MSDHPENIASLARQRAIKRIADTLQRGSKGKPIANLANAILVLQHDPDLKNLLAFSTFTGQLLLTKAPPDADDSPNQYPRAINDNDLTLIQAYVQRIWLPTIPASTIFQAVIAAGNHAAFHPVRQYLDNLVWDRNPRIDTWLTTAFGCPTDDYHTAIGAKFLIAAVRRVRDPGCQFDHMPILEGPQDIGKSRSCRALFGDEWFTDDMPHDFQNKDAPQSLLGVWGVELGEIDQILRNHIETVKAFLSRRVDRFRPPYGRTFLMQPRQMVFIGTTNSESYLRDTTGNRRIWPIKCKSANPEWIATYRNQLWAEANEAEALGESIWLDDQAIKALAIIEQAKRMVEDPWAQKVHEYVDSHAVITIHGILAIGLSLKIESQDKAAEMRVADILRSEGWVRETLWNKENKRMEKCWNRPQ